MLADVARAHGSLIAAGLVGLTVLALGLPTLWMRMALGYDEGIALSSGTFVRHGLVPYRDFYSVYGPATGYLVALIQTVAGTDLVVYRAVGLVVAGLQGSVAFFLAARFTSRLPAALLAIGAGIAPLTLAGPSISSWAFAMLASTAAVLVCIRSDGTRARLMAGMLMGVAILFRLDVGAYVLIATLVMWRDLRLVAGLAIVAGIPVLALVVAVPITTLVSQLVWFPLVVQREFRGLPTPMPWDATEAGAAYLNAVFFLVPIGAIVVGAVEAARTRSRELGTLVIFAALCHLQAAGRADLFHAAQALTPAWLVLAVVAGRTWRPSWPRLAVLLALVPATIVPSLIGIRTSSAPPSPSETQLVSAAAYIGARTLPSEPIFVGLAENRYTFANPLVAYFLADRAPATAYSMYNPGVTNTDEVQREMVAQLEASGARFLLLDVVFADYHEESNKSRTPGSTILDEYIDARFATALELPTVVVKVRR